MVSIADMSKYSKHRKIVTRNEVEWRGKTKEKAGWFKADFATYWKVCTDLLM